MVPADVIQMEDWSRGYFHDDDQAEWPKTQQQFYMKQTTEVRHHKQKNGMSGPSKKR